MTERDRLAEQHLGLVHALCRRFAGRGVEYEELFAAGCLGLTKALGGFDAARGLQFSTYAFPVISGEIKRLFRDGGTVKVSRSLRELAMKIEKLNRSSGGELTVGELAKDLGVSEEAVAEAICSTRAPLSLNAEAGDGGAPPDVPVPDMQEMIADRLSLRAAVDALSADDRALIRLRYYQGKTQTQTADILHMTQVRVSRREKKILAELRKRLE